jgi:hypothetical protein
LGGESSVEKRVLMRVVFPRPDSPGYVQLAIPSGEGKRQGKRFPLLLTTLLTNDHNREVRTALGDDLVSLKGG